MPDSRIFHAGIIIALLCGAFAFGRQSTIALAPSPKLQSQQPAPGNAPVGSVSGHVYRADTAAPLAGAILGLYPNPWFIPGGPPPVPPRGARSGPDGSYTFASLEPGSYNIQIEQRSGFVISARTSPVISVAAGQAIQDLDFRLQPAGAVSGSVSDEDDDPIPGMFAVVFCQDPTGRRASPVYAGEAVTDDRGNFRVSPLRPGNCYVGVAADFPAGNRPLDRAKYYPNADAIEKAQLLDVKPGEEIANIRFHVPLTLTASARSMKAGQQETPPPSTATALGSVSGRTYRADTGAPLPGAVIHLVRLYVRGQAPAAGLILPLQAARSGTDGTYTFASVEPGTYKVRVEHYGFAPVPAPDSAPAMPGENQVSIASGQPLANADIRLQPTGAISGRVLDQDDVPLQGIFVTVFRAKPHATVIGAPLQAGHATTDDRGNFRVSGVDPGDCYFGGGPGPGPMSQLGYRGVFYPNEASMEKAQLIRVKPEEETRNLRLTVRYSPTFKISVKVVEDRNGGGDNRYFVAIRPTDEGALRMANTWGFRFPPPAFMRPDGTVDVRGVTPGTYRIQIIPARATLGPNGEVRGWSSGGEMVGSAIVQVVDADVSIEIPISRLPTGGSPR